MTQYFNHVSNLFTVIDVASEKSKILDFFFFVEEVHALSSCEENECQVEACIDALKGLLFNSEQSCHEQITSFISHSLNYAKTFKSMTMLKKDEGYVLALLSGLTFLHDKTQPRISRTTWQL